VINPAGVPDFGISSYFLDFPILGQQFIRLRDERARPLIASGSTPIGTTFRSFRTWYAGCAGGTCPSGAGWKGLAAANDPDWPCRRKFLVLLTDSIDTCGTIDPCSVASSLRNQDNLLTYAVGFGADPFPSQLGCIAHEGGTSEPFYTQTKTELIDALNAIFTAVKTP
jgi:hypothetical protein